MIEINHRFVFSTPTLLTTHTQELADWNARYDAKFGHIFLVYASGRSAESMLAELKQR